MKKLVLPLFWLFALLLFTHSATFASSKNTPEDDCSWSAPLNLRDSLRGATSMFVNWDTPVEGVPPGGYIVKVFQGASVSPFNTIPTLQLSARLDNLTPGTDYRIEVSSVCGNGETGPAALMNSGTIVVEFIVNGENMLCLEPNQQPIPATSDIYNPFVPTCNGASTGNNCAGIFYSYPGILNANSIVVYNFKVSTGPKFYWFTLEIKPDNHFRIKTKGFYQNVSAQLAGNYLTIKTGASTNIAQVGFFINGFHLTRLTGSTVVGLVDKFSECPIGLLLGSGDSEDSNVTSEAYEKKYTKTGNIISYPNPVENVLNIIIPSDCLNEGNISIFDISGNELLNKNYKTDRLDQFTNINLDLSGFFPGVYYLGIYDGNKRSFIKIVKI